MVFDVALAALADISRDARTLNLARALSKEGLKTAVVGAASTDLSAESFTFQAWPDPGGSAFNRWRSLSSFAQSCTVRANVVAGMDLFALKAARALSADGGKTPLVYDMREFYFALGPLEGRGLKQRVIERYERYMLRHVDKVMVAGPLDADVVRDRFRLREHPHVMLNTPPYKDPVQSDVLRERFSIDPTSLVVLYQGVVHHGRGLVPFMHALKLLSNVHLCIVGDGPAVDELKRSANTIGVAERVHWYGPVPYDGLHEVTCSADVGLCLIEPVSMSYEYALPNKLFEYMMARKPSLVTDLPALGRQIRETPVGMLIGRDLDARRIAEAVDRLRVPATYSVMQNACGAIRSLAFEQQAQRTVDIFRELL